jgi:hypothetical protein
LLLSLAAPEGEKKMKIIKKSSRKNVPELPTQGLGRLLGVRFGG